MHRLHELLRLIADAEFHPAGQLAGRLGLSYTATRELLNILDQYGLTILKRPGKGHRLAGKIDLLEPVLILSGLPPEVKKCLDRFEIFTTINSTNQYLLEKMPASRKIHAVLAEHQTSGRGRSGNSWFSPMCSGINLSILWHFSKPMPASSFNCLPLAVGSAVLRALTAMGFKKISLKWPNDIVSQGRKLAGILIETKGKAGQKQQVVIGLGLNTRLPTGAQNNISQAYTDLASIKKDIPSRNDIAISLISGLILLLNRYMETRIQDIITEWQKYDCIRGKKVQLILPRKTVTGRAAGIDNKGALLIAINGKIEKYTSGDLNLRIAQ